MNLTIDKSDEIYNQVENSILSLRELVIVGLQTASLIQAYSGQEYGGADFVMGDYVPYGEDLQEPQVGISGPQLGISGQQDGISEPNWEVLNEIQKIKLMLGGSANKGKGAEMSILNSLSKFFPDAEVDATGYESGKGDIVMNLGDFKIMLEVKNYNTNVPTKEQDKFHRDLINNDYKAAIMVSCNSGIAGHKNQFDYKNIGNKFAVYLSNAGNDALSVMWAVLFIKSSLGLVNKIKQENKDNQELVSIYVENKLKIIKDCIEDNVKMREAIFNMKSAITRTVDNSIEHMVQSMNLSKNRLENLVENFNELIDSGKLSTDLNILYADVSAVKTLEEYTVSELKIKAKALGIKKLSKMTKSNLLEEIRKAKG